MERSPLKYPFARAITCVIPSSIVGDTVVAKKKDGQLIELSADLNRLEGAAGDVVQSQFSTLCRKAAKELNDKFLNWTEDIGLDEFYSDIFTAEKFPDGS